MTPGLLAGLAMSAALGATGSLEDLRPGIEGCLTRMDPAFDVGYERLAARCPDLARRLAASGWEALLSPGWDRPGSEFNAASLRELSALMAAELGSAGRGPHPDPTRVARLIGKSEPAPGDPRETATPGGLQLADADASRWRADPGPHGFANMRSGEESWLPHQVSETVAYGALLTFALLAAYVVVIELRSGRGWVRPQREPRAAATSIAGALNAAHPPCTGAMDEHSPGSLLAHVVAELETRSAPAQASAMTVSELTARAALDPLNTQRLECLARASERISFAREPPGAGELAAAVGCGLELLEALRA